MLIEYIIISVFLVSLISFAGVSTLLLGKNKINNLLLPLISLAAGTLLGDVFFHLIPEAVEKSGFFSVKISFFVLIGFNVFLLLDNLIHWKHSHSVSSLTHKIKINEELTRIRYLNLVGDGLHNFLDGVIIAASYFVSLPVGIATTMAVIFHEIPQEIADFGVLIYSGLSKWKALLFNFVSALTAVIGAIVGIILGARSELFASAMIPIAGGAFLYIGASNLIPELFRKEQRLMDYLKQFSAFVIGILIMYGLLLVG